MDTPKEKEQKQGESEMVENENPRANENIRVRSAEPDNADRETLENEVGSEITDGEDG